MAATWPIQRGEPVWKAAGFPGISAEVLMGRWLTLKAHGKKGKKRNVYLVGVAGFEPAPPERCYRFRNTNKINEFRTTLATIIAVCSRGFGAQSVVGTARLTGENLRTN
jgi:hypothetical protein